MTEFEPTAYRPSSASPPGDTLAEIIDARGLTQADLARRTGRPLKTINEIIKGKTAILPDTALELERAVGVPASFWLAREANYREWVARREDDERLLADVSWLRELPLADMQKFGWVDLPAAKSDRMKACLNFFRVSSVAAWRGRYADVVASYRAPARLKRRPGAVAAWMRQAEVEAAALNLQPFNGAGFREAVLEARCLTTERSPETFMPRLQSLCAAQGVGVVLVRAPQGCPAHGATRWLDPTRALIQLSAWTLTDDQLWFTFFHEAAHVLHGPKRATFIDVQGQHHDSEAEEAADRFAAELLIPKARENDLAELGAHSGRITAFAATLGIAPGIVVGRMQRLGLLGWNQMAPLKRRFTWP